MPYLEFKYFLKIFFASLMFLEKNHEKLYLRIASYYLLTQYCKKECSLLTLKLNLHWDY